MKFARDDNFGCWEIKAGRDRDRRRGCSLNNYRRRDRLRWAKRLKEEEEEEEEEEAATTIVP